MQDLSQQLGERIRIAREEAGITQDQLATKLSINDRQTISAIEAGSRQIQPNELAKICQFLAKPLAFFTDPYVVANRSAFSYRAKANAEGLKSFEDKAHKLISANRRFRQFLGEPSAPIGSRLKDVKKSSTITHVTRSGEQISEALGLGETPSAKLRDTVETQLRVSVLYVDAPNDISGAACHLPEGDFILINRSEPSFRRNFDLGHELFHLLTWDEMPPGRLDAEIEGAQKPKVEKMADAFTAGLLMPTVHVRKQWTAQPATADIHTKIVALATQFGVSGSAMYWRLVNTGLLEQADQKSVRHERLTRSSSEDRSGKPNLLNADFVRRLHTVLTRGLISARKAADLLECDLEDVRRVCTSYGHSAPFAF